MICKSKLAITIITVWYRSSSKLRERIQPKAIICVMVGLVQIY